MSGSTTELNLRTAVDADDNADYLTLDLANSLRTLDALFNNVTGHNHSSAHQGGPLVIGAAQIADGSISSSKIADGSITTVDLADGSVTSAKLSPPIDIAGYFRSTSVASYPTSGVGLEMYYSPGTGSILQSYDRAGNVYAPALLIGSTVSLRIGGTPCVTVNADFSVQMAGPLTLGNGTINFNSGIVILNDGNSLFYRSTAPGQHYFQHTDGSPAPINVSTIIATGLVTAQAGLNVGGTINTTTLVTNTITIQNGGTIDSGPAQYVKISQLTVTPGLFAAANSSINGTLAVNGAFSSNSTSPNTFNGDLTVAPPRVINMGAALLSPGTNLSRSPETLIIQTHAYVYFDLGVGHTVTCQSLVQTSDPRLKSNALVMPDADCMTRVRGNVPVYSYQLPPPTEGGDSSGEPTPTPTDIGFMADDVHANSPEFAALDETGTAVGVNYPNMVALLWGALRHLDARVQSLEAA